MIFLLGPLWATKREPVAVKQGRKRRSSISENRAVIRDIKCSFLLISQTLNFKAQIKMPTPLDTIWLKWLSSPKVQVLSSSHTETERHNYLKAFLEFQPSTSAQLPCLETNYFCPTLLQCRTKHKKLLLERLSALGPWDISSTILHTVIGPVWCSGNSTSSANLSHTDD